MNFIHAQPKHNPLFRHDDRIALSLIAWQVEKNVSGETKVSFWISFNFFYDGKFILSTGWIPFVWHCVILMKKFPEILETTGLGGNLPEKVVILEEKTSFSNPLISTE